MEIFLPDHFDRNSMYSFISDIIYEDNRPKNKEIILNFSSLEFIKPSGITILHNIIQWLLRQNVKVYVDLPDLSKIADNRNSVTYLDDSGFFEYYLKKRQFENSHVRPTTIPLKNVTFEEYYSWLDNTLVAWLAHSLQIADTSGFSGLKTCIGEIFNNIKDHSGEKIGCVFAQHYPANNEIEIAISDFGVGIPCQIRKKFDCKNDAEALELAIKEGYTTKSLPTNRGAGLENLLGFVLGYNGGRIYIHSNKGKLECHVAGSEKVIKSDNSEQFYPGTLVLIKLRTDTIYEEPDEEDFSW
ncbi:hypothetical protein [Desulfonema magnum]|uniref:Kinase domain-containing protein n=1 Tax=Desulfonema magnum TaxID=45655 RepID=A0A975BI21_9BACT|nr:hypothetical protein [Desulfonema magnum]QTA85435.1 kinase domain-containing protein [Desulfonema magnum]